MKPKPAIQMSVVEFAKAFTCATCSKQVVAGEVVIAIRSNNLARGTHLHLCYDCSEIIGQLVDYAKGNAVKEPISFRKRFKG